MQGKKCIYGIYDEWWFPSVGLDFRKLYRFSSIHPDCVLHEMQIFRSLIFFVLYGIPIFIQVFQKSNTDFSEYDLANLGTNYSVFDCIFPHSIIKSGLFT